MEKNSIIYEILKTLQSVADPNANSPVPAAEETLRTGEAFQISKANFFSNCHVVYQ